jgi:hypothetical protein
VFRLQARASARRAPCRPSMAHSLPRAAR